MNEQENYDVIKKLVETNGNKQRAAVTLGCTLRTVNRLIQRYKQEGKAAICPRYVTSLEKRKLHSSNHDSRCDFLLVGKPDDTLLRIIATAAMQLNAAIYAVKLHSMNICPR